MIKYYCDKCGSEIVDVTNAYSVDINPFELYDNHHYVDSITAVNHPYANSITAVNHPYANSITATGKRIYCEKCVEGFK